MPTDLRPAHGFQRGERHRDEHGDGAGLLGERLPGHRLLERRPSAHRPGHDDLADDDADQLHVQLHGAHHPVPGPRLRPTSTPITPPRTRSPAAPTASTNRSSTRSASGSPGNWGTINVGVSNNSTSILGAQIRYGITPGAARDVPQQHDPARYDPDPAVDHLQRRPRHQRGDQGRPGGDHRQAGRRADLRPERRQRQQRLVPRDRVPAGADPQRQLPGQPQVRDHPALPDERPTAIRGSSQSWSFGRTGLGLSLSLSDTRVVPISALSEGDARR